jgi:cystathionine gamma-lyase
LSRGPSTRAVHAGLPAPQRLEPLLPGPVLAATFHLPGEAEPGGYARLHHPTVGLLEDALGDLDGGECVAFASGAAAVGAVLERLRPGELLVAPEDGYPAVRQWSSELEPRGVRVRLVPSSTEAFVAAAPDAALVWIETPANPRLEVVDVGAVAAAARGLVAVDNTVATPLGQQPLALGADVAMCSGTKSLAGHSDLLLGALSTRDADLAAALRGGRARTGAVPGAFEAWLAHRSLATLGLRLERASANSVAVAAALRERGLEGVVHPADHPAALEQMRFFGPLVGFTLAGAERAQRFLAACRLVAEATSFGGVHSTAERRSRWGHDAVPEGFIRLSCGVEDTGDLVADVLAALDSAA